MEEATKPLLESLIYGESRTLSVTDQRQLAAWVTKTTMTAEFLEPKETAIAQTEREDLRLRGEPGARWQIWIAFYIGSKQVAGGIFHHGVGLYPPPLPMRVGVKNTQFTVMGLGRLLAISLSSEQDLLTFHMHGEATIAVKGLWPLGSHDLIWPPERSIDDGGADRIIASFGRMLGIPLSPI
jgi:hypothetical protein